MNQADMAWMLVCSALVLLMTPGLALFYGGLARSKNAAATVMHSFMSMGIVGIVWVLWGYTLAFGPDVGRFIGSLEYLGLNNVSATAPGPHAENIPHQTFMIFQGMFAIIAPALITGAFAERMKFKAYVLFTVLWVTVVYAPVAHWVWGGGWMDAMGALDFAGGNVVHINTGVAALAAAVVFGRRLGFGSDPMEPHNIPMVVLGAGLLWFGWFGFNAGLGAGRGRQRGQRVRGDQYRGRGGDSGLDGRRLGGGTPAVGDRGGVRGGGGPGCRDPGRGLCGSDAGAHHWLAGRNLLLPGGGVAEEAEAGRLAVRSGACTASAAPGARWRPVYSWGWASVEIAAFTDASRLEQVGIQIVVDPGHLGLGVCDDDGDSLGDQADGRAARLGRRRGGRPGFGRARGDRLPAIATGVYRVRRERLASGIPVARRCEAGDGSRTASMRRD